MHARRSKIGSGVPLDTVAPRPTGADRRRVERIQSVVRATVRQAEVEDSSPTRARAVDICEDGVRLLLRRRLAVGSRVLLDMECDLPLRVHLGFEADSLVIDGPVHTHLVRIAGTVVRTERLPNRLWSAAVQFCPDTTRFDELQLVRCYVDHLREQESWIL